MSDIDRLREVLVAQILEGEGVTSREQRRAAFRNSGLQEPLSALVDKVARHAYRVTDEDIAAAIRAGASEDEIFELVICAAVGEATRQYEVARAALDAANTSE
jgi:threonine synthase